MDNDRKQTRLIITTHIAASITSTVFSNSEAYYRQLSDWKKKYGDDMPVKTAIAKDAVEIADEIIKELDSEPENNK